LHPHVRFKGMAVVTVVTWTFWVVQPAHPNPDVHKPRHARRTSSENPHIKNTMTPTPRHRIRACPVLRVLGGYVFDFPPPTIYTSSGLWRFAGSAAAC